VRKILITKKKEEAHTLPFVFAALGGIGGTGLEEGRVVLKMVATPRIRLLTLVAFYRIDLRH
jgi:hypothetical protein